MVVRVFLNKVAEGTVAASGTTTSRVAREPETPSSYVINLSSSRTSHATSEMQAVSAPPGLKIFETEVQLAGTTWYRLRIGNFDSAADAQTQLAKLRNNYPTAWIDSARMPTSKHS